MGRRGKKFKRLRRVPLVGQTLAANASSLYAVAKGKANRKDWSRALLGMDIFPNDDRTNLSPTAAGAPGSNAGDFNSAREQADAARAQHEAQVDAWQASRSPYYDQIRDTQYQQALGQINDQQRDLTQNNALNQSRAGTRGGSADLSAQANIQQQGLQAQGQAFMSADAAALKQQQIDADHAAWMKQQGYNYYDPVAKLGSFQAGNLERLSSKLYDWRNQTTQQRNQMQAATQGIKGAFTGGVMNAGMTQFGGSAGQGFGSAGQGSGSAGQGSSFSPYNSDLNVGNTQGQGQGNVGLNLWGQ